METNSPAYAVYIKARQFLGANNYATASELIIMTIEIRNLLIFQLTGTNIEEFDAYNELSKHHWEVHVANNIQQVSELLEKHTFHVGLCLIDRCTLTACFSNMCCKSDQCSTLNRLFNLHSSINWIMGLPREVSPRVDTHSIESQLIAEYCFDYITLPIDTKQLLFALGHAQGMNKISRPFHKKNIDYELNFGIVGSSPAMQKLFRLLKKISNEDCSVLIQGETGTGKELIANAIHNYSTRSEQPMVTVNCGAFPKDLIQAELFGYEKGAFTGAQQRKIGCIESAHGGTLFLDEVGDLPLEQQVNLLRFLEDRTIRRIGGSENIAVDVRVIAATHVDLKAEVQLKQFREDLFYRLQVLQVETPPLREREGDIERLAWYFFNKFSVNNPYVAKGFQLKTLSLMADHEWPGNVRELMNCVRHAIVMSENSQLSPEDMGLERRRGNRSLQTLEEARAIADRELIIASLRYTRNNISRAAEVMGISRVSLYRLIDKYSIINA